VVVIEGVDEVVVFEWVGIWEVRPKRGGKGKRRKEASQFYC